MGLKLNNGPDLKDGIPGFEREDKENSCFRRTRMCSILNSHIHCQRCPLFHNNRCTITDAQLQMHNNRCPMSQRHHLFEYHLERGSITGGHLLDGIYVLNSLSKVMLKENDRGQGSCYYENP